LNDLVSESGRGSDELVQDAVAAYFDELMKTQGMLNSRYDDLKGGTVEPSTARHSSNTSAARGRITEKPLAAMSAGQGFELHPLAAEDITDIWAIHRRR